jgi:arsenical pump membrane protein
VGLNVGPNLAVTGSLSAVLWLAAAQTAGVRPSVTAYSRQGALLVPIAVTASLAVAGALGSGPL